jgi:hypothetical protein
MAAFVAKTQRFLRDVVFLKKIAELVPVSALT